MHMKSALSVLLNCGVPQASEQSKARFVCGAVSVYLKLLALNFSETTDSGEILELVVSWFCILFCSSVFCSPLPAMQQDGTVS